MKAWDVLYDRHTKRVWAGLELPNVTASAGEIDQPGYKADAVGVAWGR